MSDYIKVKETIRIYNKEYETISYYEYDNFKYRYLKKIKLNENPDLLDIYIIGQNPASDDNHPSAKIKFILNKIINDIGYNNIRKIKILNLFCRCDTHIEHWNNSLMDNEYENKNIEIIEEQLSRVRDNDKIILFHGQHFTTIPKFNWIPTYIKFYDILFKTSKDKDINHYGGLSETNKRIATMIKKTNIPFPRYKLNKESELQPFPIKKYIHPLNY